MFEMQHNNNYEIIFIECKIMILKTYSNKVYKFSFKSSFLGFARSVCISHIIALSLPPLTIRESNASTDLTGPSCALNCLKHVKVVKSHSLTKPSLDSIINRLI